MPPKSTRRPAETLQPPTSCITKALTKTARPARVAPNNYPWDSHQDDLIVETIEEGRRPHAARAGVAHYLHLLAQEKDYKHITTDFDEYRRNFLGEEDLPKYNDLERDEGRVWEEQEGIKYTHLPVPPDTLSAYEKRIYKASTSNPAVFLAIIRLAEHNLPFLDFSSPLSHLPNHPPVEPLPKLIHGTFCANVPVKNKITDTPMTVLFLPEFYEDGRHALGFYTFQPPAHPSSNPAKALFQSVKNVVFTPCTTSDLETYDLVEYLHTGKKGKGKEKAGGGGADSLKWMCMGAREGTWLDQEVVEEYEEWSEGVRIVRSVWERRVELCCGAEEAPGPVY
jgi:hypothetical protein